MKKLIQTRWGCALSRAGLALLLGWGLAGCGRNDIRIYTVPKEKPPTLPKSSAAPTAPAQPIWTVPEGWTDKGVGGMRAGSFAVSGPDGQAADVSVIALSSWAGQELQNVNRWRAQVGMQPIGAEELSPNTTPVTIAGQPGQLFEMAGMPLDGDKSQRILVAVLPLPQMAWFFKMTGDDALVQKEKAPFIAFLESARFGPAPAAPPAGETPE